MSPDPREDGRDPLVRAQRAELILGLPDWTLIRCGWEVSPGLVQGGVHYRYGTGLGPIGRDQVHSDILRREVEWVPPHPTQRWGMQVLATPDVLEPLEQITDIRLGFGRLVLEESLCVVLELSHRRSTITNIDGLIEALNRIRMYRDVEEASK